MATREDELEYFKTQINFTTFAAAEGYELDRKSSSRNSAVMVSGGHKIIIAVAPDQHWIYFTIGDDYDNGSIIDFAQNLHGGTLGDVRKMLRPWIGRLSDPPRVAPVAKLEPISRDMAQVRARYEATQSAPRHPYLIDERCIPTKILEHPVFANRVRIDSRNNAVFPHWNRDGICGFEIKNRNFTGFAPGGTKGLWGSRPTDDDRRLVIAETAIDALSYAAMKGVENTRFASVAGEMNRDQPELVKSAIKRMPPGSQVIAAMDADGAGQKLAETVEALFREISPAESVFVSDPPPPPSKDYNDALRAPVGPLPTFP